MPKYGYVVAEGPHDAWLVYRLLRPFGLELVRLKSLLDPFFIRLVPTNYPPKDDLLKRVPVPLFLQSTTHAVAVHSAEGDRNLIEIVEENAVYLDVPKLTGIGILLDSDSNKSAVDRYIEIRDGLREMRYPMPDGAGAVSMDTPRLGAFVLPDNMSGGTLEDILLECGPSMHTRHCCQRRPRTSRPRLGDHSLTADDTRAEETGRPQKGDCQLHRQHSTTRQDDSSVGPRQPLVAGHIAGTSSRKGGPGLPPATVGVVLSDGTVNGDHRVYRRRARPGHQVQ